MTGAELKTIRESLGLPLQWVADQAGVQLRSAQYWESGQRSVPEDVADMVRRIDRAIWHRVAEAVGQISAAADEVGNLPEQIDLLRYRTDADLWRYQPDFAPLPATCHGMMLARFAREIQPLGVTVSIVYMQPDRYEVWLAGRADSAALRAAWAGEAATL